VEDKCDGPCVLIGGNHDQTLQDLPQNEVRIIICMFISQSLSSPIMMIYDAVEVD